MSNFGDNFFFQNIHFCFFGLLLVTYLGKSWKISRKSLQWIPRTIHMNFWAKSRLKSPLLGRIRVFFFQTFTLVTCLKYSLIIAKNFRKIFWQDSENRAKKRGKKWGKKDPVWHNCFFLKVLGIIFFRV